MTNSSNWSYHLVFIFELGLMPCSQHYYQVRDIELRVESSLCIQGVLSRCTVSILFNGIIPMYMGSTKHQEFPVLPSKNHPHVYGEYMDKLKTGVAEKESSPCIWGVPRYV